MRVGLHLHLLKGKLLRFKLLDSTVVSEWHLSQRPLRTGHASQNLILRGDLENVPPPHLALAPASWASLMVKRLVSFETVRQKRPSSMRLRIVLARMAFREGEEGAGGQGAHQRRVSSQSHAERVLALGAIK